MTKLNGNWGEDFALKHLERKGYQLLERNWRTGRIELDLILKDGVEIVFVEVKSKHGIHFGSPLLAVNQKKEERILLAATQYCEHINWEGAIRFDLIEVLYFDKKVPQLKHYTDAFFPGSH